MSTLGNQRREAPRWPIHRRSDPASGELELVWNADNGTAVIVLATVQAGADSDTVRDELRTFGNTLID